MARKVLLCGDETIGYIEHRLTPYIGTVAAEVSDHRPLLGAVLEQYFTGSSKLSVHEVLMSYPRIPTDVAREIERDITNDLVQYINRGFGCVYPGRQYRFEMVDDGEDVLICEYLPGELSEQFENVESQPNEVECDMAPGIGVTSSITSSLPVNAIYGNVSYFERQRRLSSRLACHSSVAPCEEEEPVVDEDPQFAPRKVAVAV